MKCYLSSLSGLVFSRQFLLTLVVGVTFGFSFAYMLLGAAGAGRRELFQGPPYPVDTSDPHDHQVTLCSGRRETMMCILTAGGQSSR